MASGTQELTAHTSLDRYLALDLSAGGRLSNLLIDRAPEEAAHTSITLTAEGDSGSMSANLTPVMSQWLDQCIGPERGPALTELVNQASEIKIAANVDGTLLEADLDRCKIERAQRVVKVLDAFNRKHKNLLERVGQLQGEYDELRATEGGRDAKTPNKLFEFGVLIPLILLPESLLNFESFRRAPIIQSDAMALGATVLVGIGIAAAAYCIGLFIRQYHFFSRPYDEEHPRAGWPLYTWGSAALFVSLGSVAGARYYYLLPKIQEAIVLGGPVPNIPMSIGSLLFGNLICFLVGAIFTFFLNDPHPIYAEKAEQLRKARARLDRVTRNEVDAKLTQIDARHKREEEEAKRRAGQMVNKPGYAHLRQCVDRLKSKDLEVIGALQNYRTTLTRALNERNRRFDFQKRELSADRADPFTRIKVDAFAAQPLSKAL